MLLMRLMLMGLFSVSGFAFGAEKDGSKKEEFKGFDIHGKEAHCPPPPEMLMCTKIYTPEDEYAYRCTQSGGKAFQCGCHHFLCSQKVPELKTKD